MKMRTDEVRSVLEEMYPMRSEMVPCFIGAPGIGKTQGIYQFAEDIGVNVVTYILSNTVPSEVSGIRMPDKDTKKMEVFDDARMSSLEDGDILFFDEVLEAPPMLWSACLTLIQDRIMASGKKLPDVFIVAASNPVASPACIPASVRNRFQFIELEFSFEPWKKWIRKTRGFCVPNSLSQLLEADSTQYNVLSPREATKLIDWYADAKDEASEDTRHNIITCMFDAVVADTIKSAVKVVSLNRQVHDAVAGLCELPEEFEDMSLADILKYLQQQPCWDEIQQQLKKVEAM